MRDVNKNLEYLLLSLGVLGASIIIGIGSSIFNKYRYSDTEKGFIPYSNITINPQDTNKNGKLETFIDIKSPINNKEYDFKVTYDLETGLPKIILNKE